LFCLKTDQVNENEVANYFKLDEGFLIESELFLSQCLEYNKVSVQMAAVETISFYCDLKATLKNSSSSSNQNNLSRTYLVNMKNTSKEHVRSGYCLAVCNLPNYLLEADNNFELIVRDLIVASKWKAGKIKKLF
jgi:hypothetical protein